MSDSASDKHESDTAAALCILKCESCLKLMVCCAIFAWVDFTNVLVLMNLFCSSSQGSFSCHPDSYAYIYLDV